MKQIFVGIAFALASVASQAALVEIVPSSQTVNVGDNVIVDVLGSGFTTTTVGGGFSLTFDPSVLDLQPAGVQLMGANPPAPPTLPWDSTFPRTETLSPGSLADFSFNNFNGVSGDFPIAHLIFKAVGAGSTALALSASGMFPFGDAIGTPMAVEFQGATVTAVPEPAAWGLLAAGLAFVGYVGARRRHSLQS
jgi:hypothetical protein